MNTPDNPHSTSAAEAHLVAEIRSGDQQAWRRLIDRYEGRLLAFVNKRIHDRTASEDIVQDAFVGFLVSLPNYDQRKPLESYLYSICAYKLTDHLRREGKRPSLQMHGGRLEDGEMDLQGSARVASSIARSGERRRIESEAISAAIGEQIERWKERGQWEKLKSLELIFVRGASNQAAAEATGSTEQQIANFKSDFLTRIKSIIHRQDLDASVFPELHE